MLVQYTSESSSRTVNPAPAQASQSTAYYTSSPKADSAGDHFGSEPRSAMPGREAVRGYERALREQRTSKGAEPIAESAEPGPWSSQRSTINKPLAEPRKSKANKEPLARSYTEPRPIYKEFTESKIHTVTPEARAELARLKAVDEVRNLRKRAESEGKARKRVQPPSQVNRQAKIEEEDEDEEEEEEADADDVQQSPQEESSDSEDEVTAPQAPSKARKAAKKSQTMPPPRQYQDDLASQFAQMGLHGAGPAFQPQPHYPHFSQPYFGSPFYPPSTPFYGAGVPGTPPYSPPALVNNHNSGNVTYSQVSDIGNDYSKNYSPNPRRSKRTKGHTMDNVDERILDYVDATLATHLRR